MVRKQDARSIVDGINAAVTITTDEWGIPHVVATSAADAFFGQGYAQARLRLFQLELWRRRGLGLLADVLGPDYLRLDIAARTFLARGDLEAEFAAYPPGDRDRIDAFVAGINAWIVDVVADPSLLPPEFVALGFDPQRWHAEDLLRIRIHGLSSNAEDEVARSVTLSLFGPEVEAIRRVLEPPYEASGTPFDPAAVNESILATYRAAREPLGFSSPLGAPVTSRAPAPPDGSNNWAIAGSRTRSGRPIVASDPHRIMTLPSLRVLIHVSCPEFDFIGMQEPYMPGVIAGHNGHVAFGITIAPADLEDLFVYELHPDDDRLYRYADGWERMESVLEEIPVAGAADPRVTHEVLFTRHGPVLSVDPERRTAVAIAAAWLQPGMTPYLASLDLVEARSVTDYLDRLGGWGNPVLNHVVADTAGGIAWQVAGRVPVRPNWDGLLPVPGDGSHEWAGMRDARGLPRLVDPPEGWVRSANQNNLSEDPSWSGQPTSWEWYSGFRARRLASVLASSDDWTVDAAAQLQNDYLVEPASELMTYFATAFADGDAEFARTEITAWDQRMTVDSRAATIFDRWLYTELPRAIRPEAARRLVDSPESAGAAADVLLDARLLTLGDARADIRLLAESRSWQVSATFAGTDTLVESTLAATVRHLRDQLGDDVAAWSWGAVHVSHLVHPLAGFPGLREEHTSPGIHAKPGSSDTVGVSFGADGVQTLGAATRLVMDVGDWDASLCVNSPGQDGSPGAPHALDQFDTWLADGYVPLLYSPERIADHAEAVLVLTPAHPAAPASHSPHVDVPERIPL